MNAQPRTKYKTCKRYDIAGHAHELTFTCFHGFKLLSKDRTRRWLIEAVDRVIIRIPGAGRIDGGHDVPPAVMRYNRGYPM